MIIYIPDPCPGVNGKLVTLAHRDLSWNESQRHLLTDIGLSAARLHGFSIADYVKLIQKARAIHEWESVKIIVPDAFGDYAKTLKNFEKFAPLLRRFGELVFVAQELGEPPRGADIVAIPARRLTVRGVVIDCAREPETCGQYIARYVVMHSERRIHLLGPAARLLKYLASRGVLQYVESFDTASYRRAPDAESKKENGGAWMVKTKEQACKWFEKWLSASGTNLTV